MSSWIARDIFSSNLQDLHYYANHILYGQEIGWLLLTLSYIWVLRFIYFAKEIMYDYSKTTEQIPMKLDGRLLDMGQGYGSPLQCFSFGLFLL